MSKAGTVALIFNHDLTHILLQLRNTNPYKGLLNGVGGKLEPGENFGQCILREIKEETNLDALDFSTQCHLMNIEFMNSGWNLGIFYFVLHQNFDQDKLDWNNEEGKLYWHTIEFCQNIHNPLLGGDGNISYWTKFSLVELRQR